MVFFYICVYYDKLWCERNMIVFIVCYFCVVKGNKKIKFV